MSRSEWEKHQALLRRRSRIQAIVAWCLLLLGAILLVIVGWLAIVGFIAVFG